MGSVAGVRTSHLVERDTSAEGIFGPRDGATEWTQGFDGSWFCSSDGSFAAAAAAATSSGGAVEQRGEAVSCEDAPLEYAEILRDSSMTIVPNAQVCASIGAEREEWRMTLKKENDGYQEASVFRTATSDDLRGVRPNQILPMTVVCGVKAPDETGFRRRKARGCACGNFEADTGESFYTSNVDIASLRAVLALAAARAWEVGALDIAAAFLNAHLPIDHKKVIVRPPAIFV